MSDRMILIVGLSAMAIYVTVWWSLQPNCRPHEVRVRGWFMTECVIRQWEVAR